MDEILNLGRINFRNQEAVFGIKEDDRRKHIYIIGKSGTGKSTLLLNMVSADIAAGRGVCLVDPHGETADDVMKRIPENRIDDVIYFNPSDVSFPIAFNPLERVSNDMRHLVASGLMSVFKKIWPDVWSARMEYILNNTLLALLEYPNSTLLGIMKMFSDKEYRKQIVDNLHDPVVKSFWVDEFAKYTQKLETEAVSAIQNKVGQFIANPLIRNIIGQSKSSFDFRKVMDEGKIFIANLSKGKVGEDNSSLLGAMVVTKIQLAAMSRSGTSADKLRDFYLYVDEFQNFATESFATILSEARKYKLNLTIAHQYIEQIEESVASAVFGNVGTLIIFRVGPTDAEFLEKEFFPDFIANDFVNLPNRQIYVKLMIDGMTSKPFSAHTLPPPPLPETSLIDTIIQVSRDKYALSQEKVEDKIAREYYMDGGSSRQVEDLIKRKNEVPLGDVLKPSPMSPKEFPKRERRQNDDRIDVGGLKDIIRKALDQKKEK
ncbi:MAG TPA: type IV secretion system DNA-binding domain-containing protein [Candidatus Paceibacterota bacterium]|nr:type IV secretion system DNA-binding domain-containing protein [Candidatus Paceibacterota bacterium]